ncbi:MAG: MFS transporter [Sphingomonadales bacterium]|nr:MFS transporter [Sphingomonadales bacterium]MDE2170437.1 MFS transporter [Sphingomonadales bacterium]
MPRDHGPLRSTGFLLAFALANAGGVLTYLPLLTLLLPLKVEAMSGAGRVIALSRILIGGAIAASLGNILAGMVVDRSYAHGGGRRRWMVVGIVLTCLAFGLILRAKTTDALMVAVLAFQLAINVLLSPVTVLMVDEVPDEQKGLAGGLLALGQPIAMLAGVGLVSAYEAGEALAYLATCAGVGLLTLPLLCTRPRPASWRVSSQPTMKAGDLVWVGLSRLLLLTANSLLAGVLVYYFETLSSQVTPGMVARRVGVISMLACAAAVPVAVGVGALPIHGVTRKRVIAVAALAAGVAIAVLGLADRWQVAALGYGLFVCMVQVYSSQHSAMVAQALRSTRHRARDLGLQNLANTVPAILGPGLVLALYVQKDLHVLIWAMLTLVAGSVLSMLMVRVRAS